MITITGPRVLVRPNKLEEVDELYKAAKAAGLEIADSREKRMEERGIVVGKVLQTTELCWQAPVGNGIPWCKPGDEVIYARYSGHFIDDPVTGETFLILNDEDIIGVVHD